MHFYSLVYLLPWKSRQRPGLCSDSTLHVPASKNQTPPFDWDCETFILQKPKSTILEHTELFSYLLLFYIALLCWDQPLLLCAV